MTLANCNDRLQELTHELVRNYPYYHKWNYPGVSFEELPIIDKATVNESRDSLCLTDAGSLLESFTSGSTGIPFRCIKTEDEQMKLSMAIHRHRRKWGLPLRYRSVLLGDTIFSHPRMVTHFANQIIKTSPHMIQGRCSALYKIAEYFSKKSGLQVPSSLLFVQNWGEFLQPAQRALIESVFRVPLLDYYGMEEMWLIAFSNKQGQLEIDEQFVHLEIIDPHTGQCLDAGEYGDIVITSYAMKSLPFVRYRSGDIGRVLYDPATKKKILELMPFRTSQIKLPDRTVDSSIFRYFDAFYQQLAVDMQIKQFQMIQVSYTSFRLVVATEGYHKEKLDAATKQLEALLKQTLFTNEVSISIECVKQISPHPVSGKCQPFVSMIMDTTYDANGKIYSEGGRP
ncbi:hypothetical protein ABE504_14190 [Paenibacillus oryzisoli]|uniref:hypothetical protein n=1 Tax=Paenibacillus oryzisoli TaxID=1850517 RepID=UPI003D290AA9